MKSRGPRAVRKDNVRLVNLESGWLGNLELHRQGRRAGKPGFTFVFIPFQFEQLVTNSSISKVLI